MKMCSWQGCNHQYEKKRTMIIKGNKDNTKDSITVKQKSSINNAQCTLNLIASDNKTIGYKLFKNIPYFYFVVKYSGALTDDVSGIETSAFWNSKNNIYLLIRRNL